MVAFMLEALLVNDAFQSALLNDKVIEHKELWSGVWFCFMDIPIWYDLRVISIATSTSVKCYSPKSFPSFKASLELYFSRIYAHMLQRLFDTSVHPNACNFFIGLLIHWICCLLSMCGVSLVSIKAYFAWELSSDTSFFPMNFYVFEETQGSLWILHSRASYFRIFEQKMTFFLFSTIEIYRYL